MMMMKRKVMVDYSKLPVGVLNEVTTMYPKGFKNELIRIINHKREYISVLPFETNDISYLIKVATPVINQSEDDFLDQLEEQSKAS